MNIYEIDASLMALVDPETGEIADWEAFEQLQMARDAKIENVACWYKNLIAEANAIKDEENRLKERRQTVERQAENKLQYLRDHLAGQNFKTSRCAITFRKTPTSVQMDDPESVIHWAETNGHFDCLKYTAPEISKKGIADLLKSGVVVPGAQLVQGVSMGVK